MPQVPARYVFVYGTLRRGDDNDITLRLPPPVFVAEARVAGTLYHLGGYPGLVLGGSGWVVGEVYAITEALERDLDALEAVYPQQSDEYVKREIPVAVAGRSLNCLVYEINPRYVASAPQIASGDWVKGRHG